MLLIATSLSLLAIVAGMFLLAKSKTENLGNFFKYVSYFIVLVGFLSLVCIAGRGAMRMCGHGGGCGMNRHEGMSGRFGDRGMRDNMECQEMMSHHGIGAMGMEGECHKGMMMEGECHKGMMMGSECQKGMKMNCCSMMEKNYCQQGNKDSLDTGKKEMKMKEKK